MILYNHQLMTQRMSMSMLGLMANIDSHRKLSLMILEWIKVNN